MQVLQLSGTPFEIGQQHGQAHADLIRAAAAERWALCSTPAWTGRRLRPETVHELATACLPYHAAYAPDLFAEMQGVAQSTGVALEQLLVLGGFTDFIDTIRNYRYPQPTVPLQSPNDDCTAFLVPANHAANRQAWFGQTWDMHESSLPTVILLNIQPQGQPAALVFTLAGCLGMIGMNSAGITVGINNLLGANGKIGVTWPFVVRRILQQTNLAAALACITEAPLAGAHNYLLLDRYGQGYNVEAMEHIHLVSALENQPFVHTNHCLFAQTNAVAQPRAADSQASSVARLMHASSRLHDSQELTLSDLQDLTRDAEICVNGQPPQHIATCGAVITCPATGDFWVVKGKPTESDYSHFHI